jgi:hypothetical protein
VRAVYEATTALIVTLELTTPPLSAVFLCLQKDIAMSTSHFISHNPATLWRRAQVPQLN